MTSHVSFVSPFICQYYETEIFNGIRTFQKMRNLTVLAKTIQNPEGVYPNSDLCHQHIWFHLHIFHKATVSFSMCYLDGNSIAIGLS